MKNGRTMCKLFLSYILLVIPMVICSFAVANIMTEELRERTDERINKEILQIEKVLNEQLISYRENAVKIATIEQLSPSRYPSRGEAARLGKEYLANIKMLDGFSDDILLCYHNEIYTSDGYSRPETYIRATLGCKDQAAELGLQILNTEEKSLVYLPSEKGGFFLYHYPVRTGKSAVDNVVNSVNYCVSSERIYSLLEPLIEQMDYCMQLTLENEWQSANIYLSGDMYEGIREISAEKYEELQKTVTWSVRKVNMELWGMKLSVAYDSGQLYEQVVSWQRMIILTMGILLFLSLVISYYISRSQYEKIYKLRRALQTAWSFDKKQYQLKSENEFDYMHAMVSSIVQETERMRWETDNAKKLMRQQGAMLLFYGSIREESAARGMLESCGIILEDSFFAVMCIVFMNDRSLSEKTVESLLQEHLSFVGNVGGRQTVIALVELSSEDYMKKQREKYVNAILQENGSEVKIAFSRAYESILRASAAYQEALMVCEQLIQTPEEIMGCADTWISRKPEILRFEEKDLTELENSVSEGDHRNAGRVLNELLRFAERETISSENKKYLRYCIIQSILIAATGIKKQNMKKLAEEITEIDLEQGEYFAEKVRWVLDEVCPAKEESTKEKEKIEFNKVVEYISQNYQRYDLSLDEVADFAGLSKAYMSRLFKEKTGSRYIDYLTSCRMEHAKRLLMETDMSMKQVAEAVGYCNVPGFRAKLKNYFGINGAEIRKMYKKDKL